MDGVWVAVVLPLLVAGLVILRLLLLVPEEALLLTTELLLACCAVLEAGVCDAAVPLVAVFILLRLSTREEVLLTLSAETALLVFLAVEAVLLTLWLMPLRAAKPLAIAVS